MKLFLISLIACLVATVTVRAESYLVAGTEAYISSNILTPDYSANGTYLLTSTNGTGTNFVNANGLGWVLTYSNGVSTLIYPTNCGFNYFIASNGIVTTTFTNAYTYWFKNCGSSTIHRTFNTTIDISLIAPVSNVSLTGAGRSRSGTNTTVVITATNGLTLNNAIIDGIPAASQMLPIWEGINRGVLGVTNYTLFFVGDSITAGFGGDGKGGTNSLINSYPYKLATLCPFVNSDGWIGSHSGSANSYLTNQDPRIISYGAWVTQSPSGNGPVFGANAILDNNTTNNAAFIYQTTQTSDYVTVLIYGGTGNVTIATNGVAATVVNTASLTSGFANAVTVNYGLSTNMQISLYKTNAVSISFYGMLFGVKNKSVNVVNCGSEGAGSGNAIVSVNTTNFLKNFGVSNCAVFYNLWANDNDTNAYRTNVNSFFTNMAALKVSGAMLSGIPNGRYETQPYQSGVAIYKTVCTNLNVPLLNYADHIGSYSNFAALGLDYDGLHAGKAGYFSLARFIAKALKLPEYKATTNSAAVIAAITTNVYSSYLASNFLVLSNTVYTGSLTTTNGATNLPVTVTLPGGHRYRIAVSGNVKTTGTGVSMGVFFFPAVTNINCCSQFFRCASSGNSVITQRSTENNFSGWDNGFFLNDSVGGTYEDYVTVSGSFSTTNTTQVVLYGANWNATLTGTQTFESGLQLDCFQTQ